ncbi:MAG TPA: sn-glycerol-3-phosphate ABC transporter ATP-binding protein UgpC [Steroidobacteraceae bacterium]
MAGVRLEALRKVYENGHVAVAGASFEVADGELVALVGPSGCGKSTLLRMVAGLESISGGTLSIGGRVVNELPARDRDIAMVFQSYALYPHMSVYDNLAFGLRLRGMARAPLDAKVRAAAATLELDALLDRKPRQLSGGQRQRVALGRALVRSPQVFLLDEPLSNLDAKLRLGMRAEIARLHRRLRATMLYVTHDQIEAMTLGQRIVVFNEGEVQQIDTPMRLYDEPANLFVAGFMGSPGMNIFRGRYAADPRPRLRCQDGDLLLPLPPAQVTAKPDQEIVVGLRPEDLRVAPQPASGGSEASLEATIENIEPVGNEIFLSLNARVGTLVCRLPPQALPELGRPLRLHYSGDRLRYFNAQSGARLR